MKFVNKAAFNKVQKLAVLRVGPQKLLGSTFQAVSSAKEKARRPSESKIFV